MLWYLYLEVIGQDTEFAATLTVCSAFYSDGGDTIDGVWQAAAWSRRWESSGPGARHWGGVAVVVAGRLDDCAARASKFRVRTYGVRRCWAGSHWTLEAKERELTRSGKEANWRELRTGGQRERKVETYECSYME